jgi:ABC-type multidrug transport system ATPase subunit
LYLKKADLTGHVLVNGLPKEERDFKRCTAYVMQDDALYAFLTVRCVNHVLAHSRLMAKRWIRLLTHNT